MRIRAGDTVLVIAGRDKGKTGRVERQDPQKGRVVVEGVNIVTRHMRGRPGVRQSGRIQMEAPLHASNVALILQQVQPPHQTPNRFPRNRGPSPQLPQVPGNN